MSSFLEWCCLVGASYPLYHHPLHKILSLLIDSLFCRSSKQTKIVLNLVWTWTFCRTALMLDVSCKWFRQPVTAAAPFEAKHLCASLLQCDTNDLFETNKKYLTVGCTWEPMLNCVVARFSAMMKRTQWPQQSKARFQKVTSTLRHEIWKHKPRLVPHYQNWQKTKWNLIDFKINLRENFHTIDSIQCCKSCDLHHLEKWFSLKGKKVSNCHLGICQVGFLASGLGVLSIVGQCVHY